MNTEKDLELVEKFFDQELSREDTLHVEERIKSDPAFRALFDQERMLIKSIRLDGLRNDLSRLKEIDDRMFSGESSKSRIIPLTWWAAAAAIITIAVLAWWGLPEKENSDALFQAYFQPYPNIFEPTVRGESELTARQQAFQAYESGRYSDALTLFGSVPNAQNDPEILMLSGNAHLMLGNTSAAEDNFLTLINNFDELDLQAKWYLSLCYLKQGNGEKARTVLSELGQTEVSYAKKAKELLDKVE